MLMMGTDFPVWIPGWPQSAVTFGGSINNIQHHQTSQFFFFLPCNLKKSIDDKPKPFTPGGREKTQRRLAHPLRDGHLVILGISFHLLSFFSVNFSLTCRIIYPVLWISRQSMLKNAESWQGWDLGTPLRRWWADTWFPRGSDVFGSVNCMRTARSHTCTCECISPDSHTVLKGN